MIDTATGTVNPSDYFPATYRESRDRILDLARRHATRTGVLIDSRSIEPKGPSGETLALDFVIFGARRPRHAVVVSSATHGVEGFAGSALQQQLIAEQLASVHLAPDCAIVVQHANNPYGFAWLRRVSEHNVDINRNFCETFDPTRVATVYESLFDEINPPDLDPDNEAQRWANITAFTEQHGMRALQQALVEGQYKYPQGLQFGGQQPEPCVTHLQDLVSEHLCDAKTVTWIDIHTGLGESGDCELICSVAPDNPACIAARAIWGDDVRSAESGESLSTPLNGVMDRGLVRWLPPDCRLAYAAAEFGTHPLQTVLRALRADNWLHEHGPADKLNDPVSRQIKAELLEALRPDNSDWRAAVLLTGKQLIEKAISSLPGTTAGT